MSAVSILMPSYNHAKFLPSTIASLQAQTLENWELVAVDDGSADESVEILQNIQDPRIRVYQNDTNQGTYGTLSRALTLANHNLVAVLDSDDKWAPQKLELQLLLMERHPEICACYTAGKSFGVETGEAEVHGDWPKTEIQELLPHLLEENRVLASSVVFRRSNSHFEATLRYSGDWVALLRAAKVSPIGYVDEPTTFWRMHGNNTFVRSKGQVAEEIRVRQSILSNSDLWRVRSLSREAVDSGLAKCAIHLSALFVLEGRMTEARAAARAAVRHQPSPLALKRLALVNLPRALAHKKLWLETPLFVPSAPMDLVRFE